MSVGHYENFPVASLLLPRPLRTAVASIYHFARGADDLADEGDASSEERLAALAAYRAQLGRVAGGLPALAHPDGPMFEALGNTIRSHGLPARLFEDLLDAFGQDVVKRRYSDFAELLDYCRRSANPVGRLLLALYRVDDSPSLRRSDAICTALQLINFWQDVAVDLQKDRIYLPADSRKRFAVAEDGLARGICDEAFRNLLRFEVERARALMIEGSPLALTLRGRMGWELRLVVQGGLRILERIELAGYDVFRRRPTLGAADWPLLAWRALRMR